MLQGVTISQKVPYLSQSVTKLLQTVTLNCHKVVTEQTQYQQGFHFFVTVYLLFFQVANISFMDKKMNFDQDIPVLISPKSITEIKWSTNYNKKMGNDCFIHITYAPVVIPSRSDIDNLLVRIVTEDGSHEPVEKRIYDLMIIPIKHLPDAFTFMSHGMTATELINDLWMGRKETFNFESNVCVYFYIDKNEQL